MEVKEKMDYDALNAIILSDNVVAQRKCFGTVFGKDKEKSKFKFESKKDKEEKESTNTVEYSNLETEIIFDTETMFDDLND